MLRNKLLIIEKDTNKETGRGCILIFDQYNGICECINEDEAHKTDFNYLSQIIRKILKYQLEGYAFQFKE